MRCGGAGDRSAGGGGGGGAKGLAGLTSWLLSPGGKAGRQRERGVRGHKKNKRWSKKPTTYRAMPAGNGKGARGAS